MSWEWITSLIENNYLACLILFVGTFLEGETILIIAGIAAQDGTPNIILVILAAFAGSLSGDQTWFFVGRCKGKAFLARRPAWQQRADKVFRILERHHVLLLLGFRFLYGLRNVTPFALGMSEVRTFRFILLNTIGAAIWALSFGMAGYLLGAAIEDVLKHYKIPVLVGLCVAVAIVWLLKVYVRRRRARRSKPA
jgi:membrane protein DedA with SNARE-associated domain